MVVRALAVLLILTAAGPSWACGILAKASPKVGSSVSAPLDHITLTFSEAVVPEKSSVSLADVARTPVKTKTFSTSKDDSALTLPLTASLAPGDYKVHWKALWKDCGSETEGNYGFSITR